MAWSTTAPTTGTYMIETPSVYAPNWIAIENAFSLQHYSFTESLSGRHREGLTPTIFVGPTSAINALSGIQGSIAFDTTLGSTVLFDNNTWRLASLWPNTRVLAYRSGDQLISQDTEIVLGFNNETVDILSEFDTSTYQFIPKSAGFFYIYGQVSFVGPGGTEVILALYQSNSSDEIINRIRHRNYTLDSNPITMKISGIIRFESGDKLHTTIWHNRSTTCVVEGGSTKSYLRIQRLS